MNIVVQRVDACGLSSSLLILGLFEDQKTFSGSLAVCDKRTDGYIAKKLKDQGVTGKCNQTALLHVPGQLAAESVLVVGLGKKNDFTLEHVRRAAAIAVNTARTLRIKDAVLSFDGWQPKRTQVGDVAQAATEGALLANYQFLKYKSEAQKKAAEAAMQTCTFIAKDASQLKQMRAGVERGRILVHGISFARDLVNEPANAIRPKILADIARGLAKLPGVRVEIYNEAACRKLGMGAFLAVASGSEEEAYLIHLSYTPKKKGVKKIAICGKGITFDSGGLSLKPGQHMDNMKMDMAGAAMILGLFTQISTLKPHAEVHGVIVATENMPGGAAMRPSDVVTAYNGKTIEITNTDAEGRLVLADALAWAEDTIKPDIMYDVATLTGSAISALGQEVAAVMGPNQNVIDTIMKAGRFTGEQMWQLPFVQDYESLMESKFADVNNLPNVYWAGSIVGGMFLKHFVKSTPWAHIDVAGPAWAEKQILPYAPYGGTGFGLRTFARYLDTF